MEERSLGGQVYLALSPALSPKAARRPCYFNRYIYTLAIRNVSLRRVIMLADADETDTPMHSFYRYAPCIFVALHVY